MTIWLFDTLIVVSALMLLVLFVRGPVARQFGAGVAYSLWLLPAARLFMPALTREVPLTSAAIAPVGPYSASLLSLEQTSGVLSAPPVNGSAILATIWLGIAAMIFIIQMVRYTRLRDELLSDATELDPVGSIRVVETDRITAPLAFGLLRRFVAVPADFARTYPARERELALAHELAHHRAGDLYVNLAAFALLCLMWFNPLAWLAWSAFRLDQEAACDARVLAGADVATRQCYGRALARTAGDPMPHLAMALNSPRTIIERMRRLMMQNPSKSRRIAGKVAILITTAIALPLTATVVPVFAEDAAKDDDAAKPSVNEKHRKIIIVKDSDGKPASVDVEGDQDTPFVKAIEKDGKTIILRSNREFGEGEVEKLVAEAEASRGEAEAAAGEAEAARGEAEAARGEAEADRAMRRVIRIHRSDGKTMAWAHASGQHAAMIPDINIHEIDANCKNGEVVTTNANGHDGQNKASVKIVMCGKGNGNLARVHAVKGLKEAQTEMKADSELTESVRKSVLESLQKQIDRLEKEIASQKDAG
jgi:bla regulator protein blaR1